MIHNDPQRPTTSHNNLKEISTTIHNDPQRPTNEPKQSTAIQEKIDKNLH